MRWSRSTCPATSPSTRCTITRNGIDVSDRFARRRRAGPRRAGRRARTSAPTSVAATANGRGHGRPAAQLTLVNHPISGPIFSGPQQQPFVCTTARATFDGRRLLGQPLVDNQERTSASPSPPRTPTATTRATGAATRRPPRRSSAGARTAPRPTRIEYVYKTTGGQFRWLDDPARLPGGRRDDHDARRRTVPYIVRWERGTINRFIYSVAMLAPDE